MLSFLKMMLTPEFFFSILRISAPILFATLGAIVVEKAGFCNIGLEGIMMFAALTGSLVSYYAGSWFWGLLAALAMGTLMGLMMGFFAFQLKTDITLVGIAVNMMGSGGTLSLICTMWIYLQEQGFCGFCIFFGMLPAGSKNKNPLPFRENIRYNITCPHSGQEDETWQNSISNTARWVRARPRPR